MSFSERKTNIIKFTKNLLNCLEIISSKKDFIAKYDKILKEFPNEYAKYDVQNIMKNLKDNLNMFERSTMKCVFIGKTSNGKSCTINAILKQKILPSDIGCTTSCFVSIKGHEGLEIYLEDIDGGKFPVADLQRLGNQLSDRSRDVNSLLRVFIPRNMCELLENDVEIIDCPGADCDEDHDEAIIRHCKDSDVFVLVLHAESTLNTSDERLMRNLKGILSNIIIVFNKWDLVESDPINEQVRNQHQYKIVKFLVEDLNLYSLSEAEKRTFFISSLKEVEKLGSDINPSLEFNLFKDALIKDLNEHAIESKINTFDTEVQRKKNSTLELLSDLPNVKSKTCDRNTMEQKIMKECKDKISEIFKNIREESEKLLDYIVNILTRTIMEAIEKAEIDDEFMAIDENYLVPNLCECFEDNMISLQNQIKDISIQYSCIDTDGDKMERFSQLSIDLDKSMKEYKEHIENNIKQKSLELQKQFKIFFSNSIQLYKSIIECEEHIENNIKQKSLELQKQSQIKKNKKDLITYLAIARKIISAELVAGSHPTKLDNPVIAHGLSIGGAVFSWASTISESLAKNTDDMTLEEEIKSYAKMFFSREIEMYLDKHHNLTNDIVMNCLNEFIEDQRNMDDFLTTFDNLREDIGKFSYDC